jgi:hypothetical protein
MSFKEAMGALAAGRNGLSVGDGLSIPQSHIHIYTSVSI